MVKDPERPTAAIAALALAMLWIGLIAGVSFLATPAKFLAPSLALPVALDAGRHTFAIFNRLEWSLAALFVVIEATWLLPALDQRVGSIITGRRRCRPDTSLPFAGIGRTRVCD